MNAGYRGLLRQFVALAALAVVAASCAPQQPAPPVARAEYAADTLFGVALVDSFRWLEQRGQPEVMEYLEAENAYTAAMMQHTQALQDTLFNEMRRRLTETDESVPVRNGDWYYYRRNEEGKQYSIRCRRPVSGGDEQIVLDLNDRARDREYYDLGVYEISPDHRYLAFSEDFTGQELYTLRVKDLATGLLLPEQIENAESSAAWSADGTVLFYVTQDEALRSCRVHRHRLGTDPAQDEEIYYEPDERFTTDVVLTKDKRFVLITSDSYTTSEVRYLRADDPEGVFRVMEPRRRGVEYYVEHGGGSFYIHMNDGARDFRIVAAPDRSPGAVSWRDVVPHQEGILIEDFDVFDGYLVVFERVNAVRRVRIENLREGSRRFVEFPEPAYDVSFYRNPMFERDSVRLEYSSFVTSETIFDCALATGELTTLKQREVGGGYDPARYEVRLVMAPARDGEQIPITMMMPRGTELNGQNPMLLEGYSAYGSIDDAYFSVRRSSLVDRGVIYAYAHARGSTAKGRGWYEDGKFLNKINTFNDYIDCAEFLIREGYTSPQKLIANGGSAGGLLIGAVVNMRPDLFRSAVAAVPFVDLMNTMLDESLPLTVGEFDEWGNPREEEYFRYMLSYSPYDNVQRHSYPSMLITAGLNDPRVNYWEPAKWTAKLRSMKTDDNLLLLNTDMGTGHTGASGRYDWLHEVAFEMAFMLESVGIDR